MSAPAAVSRNFCNKIFLRELGEETLHKKAIHNTLWAFATIGALGVSYWFFRFVMFDMHGMKQWPAVLGIVSLAVLVLSLILKQHCLSATTDLGYIGGFAIAFLFHSDGVDAGGARTNNLWIIWTVTLLACIVVGIVIEMVLSRSRLNKRRK